MRVRVTREMCCLMGIRSIVVLLCISTSIGCARSEPEGPKDFDAKGNIVAVDPERGEATIEHEEVKGLMSAMTMDFPAADKKLLAGLQRGDEVSFTLRKTGDQLEIVAIKKTGSNLVDGGEIYKQSCARCHGENGEGAKKGISLIEGHALSHPEEDFLKQVRDGGEKMPSFSDKLSEKEIIAVVRHVREVIQKDLRKDGGHEH